MKLILCTHSKSPSSWILRFLMWSPWSHSAIYDEENEVVYDTTLFGGGVRKHDAKEFFAHYNRCEIRDINIAADKIAEARAWLEAQLGKPYDWTALLSWVVHRDWSEDDAWFCSEMTETFRTMFEKRRFVVSASRITPQIQAMTV